MPGSRRPAVRKFAEDVRARGRVRDLGVELEAVDRAAAVPDGRDRAGRRCAASGTKSADTASTWSPWLIQTSVCVGHAGEELVGLEHVGRSARPYSRAAALSDPAPQGVARQLHAVADAQDRHAELEDVRIAARRARLVDAGRPAGEDDAPRARARGSGRRRCRAARSRSRRAARGPGGRSAGRTGSRSRGPAPAPTCWGLEAGAGAAFAAGSGRESPGRRGVAWRDDAAGKTAQYRRGGRGREAAATIPPEGRPRRAVALPIVRPHADPADQ